MKKLLALLLFLFAVSSHAQVANDLIVGDCILVNQEDPTLAFWWTRCLGPFSYPYLAGYDPVNNRGFAYPLGATGTSLVAAATPSAAAAIIGAFSLPSGG